MQPKKRKMETLLPESVKNEESIDEIKKRAKLMAKPAESKKENEPECENCELWIVQKNTLNKSEHLHLKIHPDRDQVLTQLCDGKKTN